jgi:hypothetical protein
MFLTEIHRRKSADAVLRLFPICMPHHYALSAVTELGYFFDIRYSTRTQTWALQPTSLVLLGDVPLLLGCGVREFGLKPKVVDLRTEPVTIVRDRLRH